MSTIPFTRNDKPTIGVELELALVDAESMALSSSIDPLMAQLPVESHQFFKPELMQCTVEIITDVCNNVGEAESDLRKKLLLAESAADQIGVGLWWGATHPFGLWREQQITETPRYLDLVNLLQEMARRLVTYGLHVHVGVDTGDKAVMICDRIMQYLPLLLSLSCSSPFWDNRNTGLHSHRSKIMEGLPTAGLPTLMRNWSEYVWLINHMVDTGFINTIREIWWDVRPHHNFGTVEVRVCDMPGNLDDAVALTALIQCLVTKLSDQIDEGTYQHDCHPMRVRQNKWRACRFGVNAQLVDSYNFEVKSVSHMTRELIERLGPTAQELGCLEYLLRVQDIADGRSHPDKQRDILDATGDSAEIVRQLMRQSRISKVV